MNAEFLKKHEQKWFFISVFSVHTCPGGRCQGLRPILKLSGG
jgi:hypothetical protein